MKPPPVMTAHTTRQGQGIAQESCSERKVGLLISLESGHFCFSPRSWPGRVCKASLWTHLPELKNELQRFTSTDFATARRHCLIRRHCLMVHPGRKGGREAAATTRCEWLWPACTLGARTLLSVFW